MPRFLDPFERVREDAHTEAMARLADLETRAEMAHSAFIPASKNGAVAAGGVRQRLFEAGITDTDLREILRPWMDTYVGTEAKEIRRLIGIKPQQAATTDKPRDTQMQKLYTAESAVPEGALLTLGQLEYFKRDVMEDSWFTALYGQDITPAQVNLVIPKKAGKKSRCITVGDGPTATHTIKLMPHMRTKKTLLHELAHAVTNARWGGDRIAGHGPEFAYTYLRLVYRRFGRQVGHALAQSFTDGGVVITPRRPSLKPLPLAPTQEG
jgi:hypothetical protein